MHIKRYSILAASVGLVALFLNTSWSQGPAGDGIQAGIQAYQQADAQRQLAASRQVDQNEFLRYRPTWGQIYGNANYYHRGYGSGIPANYYSSYSYRNDPFAPSQNDWGVENPAAYRYAPFAAGYSIVGGYYYPPPMIRQPIGRREIQTGPNRWESFSVYPEDEFCPVHSKTTISGPREF